MMGKYVPNPAMERMLASSLAVKEALEERAKEGADRSRDIAPVASGDYRNSIEGVAEMDGGKAVGYIRATDWKSGWIEFGTIYRSAQAVLRRGAEAAGLKVRAEKGTR